MDARLRLKSDRSGFQALCPACDGVAPVKTLAVGKVLGLGENATMLEILKKMGLDQTVGGDVAEPSDCEDADPISGCDDTVSDEDDLLGPVPRPCARVVRRIPATGQEVLLEIVRNSKLPADTADFLIEWIRVNSTWTDPWAVRELFLKAGVPQVKASQIAEKFAVTMELTRKKAEVGTKSPPGFGADLHSTTLEFALIQKVIERNNGIVTSDLIEEIDRIRRMFSERSIGHEETARTVIKSVFDSNGQMKKPSIVRGENVPDEGELLVKILTEMQIQTKIMGEQLEMFRKLANKE